MGGAERLYVWEVARLIVRLAGANLYYDSEALEETSLNPDGWKTKRALEDNPEEEKAIIPVEVARLEQLWQANPPNEKKANPMLRAHHPREFAPNGTPMRRFMDYEEGDTFVVGTREFFKLGESARVTDPNDFHPVPEIAPGQSCCEFC